MKHEGFRKEKDKQVSLIMDYQCETSNCTMSTIVPEHIFMEIFQLATRQRHHLVKTYYSRWRNFDKPDQNINSYLSRVKYQRNEPIIFYQS